MHRLETSECFDVLKTLRSPKVDQLNIPLRVGHNISAFDITVHDLIRMEIVDSLAQLSSILSNNIFTERAIVSQSAGK